MNNNQSPAKSVACADTHAIETAVFAVELMQAPAPDAAKAVKQALDAFAEELPGEQEAPPPGLFVALSPTMPPFGEALRFVAKRTGEHAWRVQLTGNVMQVMCTEYTRFAEVWPQAKRYLQGMLAALDPAFGVANISHQYVDKFLYPPEMQKEQYSVAELFRQDTPYLTAQAWNSGLDWHVFQGWFDYEHAPERRMLHQVNTTNAVVAAPIPRYACIIDHRCSLQYPAATPPTAGALATQNGQLDSYMQELHEAHKQVFCKLLNPAKLQEIGMEN